eukprot:EG_transcript_30789
MPQSASQINDLVQQLGPTYTDKVRLKADVKRLLGITDGNWLISLFSGEPAKARPWVLTAELGFWVTGNRLKLAGYITPYERDKSIHVPINLWLPPEYPAGYPTLYILPAKHTRLIPGHQNVGPDGMFYHPYISTWSPSHTLEELLSAVVATLNERPALEDTTLQDLAAGVYSTILGIGN